MHVCNYQRILQPLIIIFASLLQKQLYGEGNERQLCVGDWWINHDAIRGVVCLGVDGDFFCVSEI